MRLNSKTALVTGAGGGLGGATARRFAEEGASVLCTDRDLARAELTVAAIVGAGGTAEAFEADIADPAQCEAQVTETVRRFSRIDILVNNAGMTRDGLLMRMKDEDWQTVLDINLTSVMRLSRAVLRSMMKARWGRIIQISSIVGYTGNPGQTNYVASKAGMTGFTKSLGLEVSSRGITANVVAPGFIETPMTDALTDDQKAELIKKVPAGMMGQAKDIAAAVVYLASPEASYVTGATIHVNGGMAML